MKRPRTFFPELDGDEQREADDWLQRYLRLVLRIQRERNAEEAAKLSTTSALTETPVLAQSVRSELGASPNST